MKRKIVILNTDGSEEATGYNQAVDDLELKIKGME